MMTKEQAVELGTGWGRATLYHRSERNRDGTAVRIRVNGKCQTWKREPGRFRLPCKWGLKLGVDVTNSNANEWLLADPTREGWETEAAEVAERLRQASAARSIGLDPDRMPVGVMRDALKEAGLLAY